MKTSTGESTESRALLSPWWRNGAILVLMFGFSVLIWIAVRSYQDAPASFYGIDISNLLPSNILRTWHLQLAIFWIATAYVAGGLLLAPSLGGSTATEQTNDLRRQSCSSS